MPRHPEYADMTKEELLELMKQRNEKQKSYKWSKHCVLTKDEGAKFEEEFLNKYNCDNLSKFVKKIVRGELIVTEAEK